MPVHETTFSTDVLARPGASLAYQVAGDGPAVVLVHGFGLNLRMWDPQVERLAARFRVVRYDCRGFGASGRFDRAVPYTHADDLLALLDHLAIEDAALVDALESVAVPTLVAVGQTDVPCFREMSAVLARRIPDAQFHAVPDAGHMVNMEQPAAVNELLIRFLTDFISPRGHRDHGDH